MVATQILKRGVRSPRVLAAMEAVPRHLFVAPELLASAYADTPLPIGFGQTISQPYMVASMAEALALNGDERVLEVGGGCGYQAAVLGNLAREVIAIEAQPQLASATTERLSTLGIRNVRIQHGDGSLGWPAGAPYDAILVSAAAPSIPPPLIEQLSENGRLVIPVGKPDHQNLIRIVRRNGERYEQTMFACRFVPLLGCYGWPESRQDSGVG